jgi:hypothetical protein
MSEIMKALMLDETGKMIADAIKRQGIPSDAQADKAIKAWLDENGKEILGPAGIEDGAVIGKKIADGAVNVDKLDNDTKLKTFNGYVTPDMFYEKGDPDYTNAFARMFDAVDGEGKPQNTSIFIPKGRYTISEKLQIPPNTYIRGCGKDSVIVCESTKDLFWIDAYTRITNISIEVNGRLSGAIFKINEETISGGKTGDGALSTIIDKIWIRVKAEVDPQVSCFELTYYYPVSGEGLPGFFDVTISNIQFHASADQKFGYFYKSYIKDYPGNGKNERNKGWVTGINISDCKIYGCRWGFFLAETDEKLLDPDVRSASGGSHVTRVQMQKNAKNCIAFLYKKKNGIISFTDCQPWDWNTVVAKKDKEDDPDPIEANNIYPYLLEEDAFTAEYLPSSNRLNINNLDFNSVRAFAAVIGEGSELEGNAIDAGTGTESDVDIPIKLCPQDYNDYNRLHRIGVDIPLYRLMPKLTGIYGYKGTDAPTFMLIHKGRLDTFTLHFDLYNTGVLCYVQIKVEVKSSTKEIQSVKVILDKDVPSGLQFGYKKVTEDDGDKICIYLKPYDYNETDSAGNVIHKITRSSYGFLRSYPLTGGVISYSLDSTYSGYNRTINCWDLPENEIYLTKTSDVKIIPKTDVIVNSFEPVLTSPNGSRFMMKVDDYGNVTTGKSSGANVQTIVSPNGTRYKLVVADDGTLETEKVTDALKTYNQGWATTY